MEKGRKGRNAAFQIQVEQNTCRIREKDLSLLSKINDLYILLTVMFLSSSYTETELNTRVKERESMVILCDVLCKPFLLYNLVSFSRTVKMRFKVIVDDDNVNPRSEILEGMHKASDRLKRIKLVLNDGLHEAVVNIRKERSQVLKGGEAGMGAGQLDHCSKDVIM